MKILHIITSAKCWAGMEQYAYDIANASVSEGNSVIFVIANDGDVVTKKFKEIGKIYRLPIKSKFDIKSILQLKKIINKEMPDVIHTHQPKNIFQAYFARGKHKNIAIIHSVHFLINPTSPHFLYKWIFSKTTNIIAVSEIVRKRFLEVYPNIKPNKILTVLNSVDSLRCVSHNKKTKKQNTIYIGYAGRIVEEKGVNDIVEAVKIISNENLNFKVLIAGKGDDKYIISLKNKIEKYNLKENIEFIGFISEISKYMELIDFALLPSIVKEAGSLMLLEYMANGKPVITTNNGGQPEVINSGENGLLIYPSDIESLAENMRLLIKDKHLREKIGKSAKYKFDNFLSFESFVKKTISIYNTSTK